MLHRSLHPSDMRVVRVSGQGRNLNGIFAPLNTGLVRVSRSHFKQSTNSMLKTRIYVIGSEFVNFLVIFGYIWVEILKDWKDLEK